MSDAQIEKLTLGEFVDAVNAELLRGKEFGTRKVTPLKEKSIKRYDEADGSGSNGMLRWKNDRGRLFYIPVDMEKTRPGGKVVLATDDANITDWIENRLNGVELRMSKTGKIYVKGSNGLEGELAEIFGRYPKAGQNDGMFEQLAADLQNEALREATPDQLVSALVDDRANYDAWLKATADGKTLEALKEEQHWADEAEREAAEARERFEHSGMGVLDYIRSRAAEEGEAAFDLDWETMREIDHDVAMGRFAARMPSQSGQEYTYTALTAKPDMPIVQVDAKRAKQYGDHVSWKLADARKSILAAGGRLEKGHYIIDMEGEPVEVGKRSILHGKHNRNNDFIYPVLGEVLKNAVRVNELGVREELHVKGKKDDQVNSKFVYLGAAAYGDEVLPVRIQIDRKAGLSQIGEIDVLKSFNAKRRDTPTEADSTGHRPPRSLADARAEAPTEADSQGPTPAHSLASISISNLIGVAQPLHPQIFSKDVAAALNKPYQGGEIGAKFAFGGRVAASNMGIKGAAEAEAMEKAGADREEVWRTTGWWRGKDGKWRVELPPLKMKGAKDIETALREGGNETTLGTIVDAPELFKAYPDMKNVKVRFDPEGSGYADAQYNRRLDSITIFNAGLESIADLPPVMVDRYNHYYKMANSDEYLRDRITQMDGFKIEHGTLEEEREKAKQRVAKYEEELAKRNALMLESLASRDDAFSVFSSLNHEIQHAIQAREMFARGASPRIDIYDPSNTISKEAIDEYRRAAGEVEARNVQKRLAMTPEERAATPPWETEDVPESRQIVKFAAGRAVNRTPEETEAIRQEAKSKNDEANKTLDKLTALKQELDAAKEAGGDTAATAKKEYYQKINKQFGSDFAFDFGRPYGRLASYVPDRPLRLTMQVLLRKMKEEYRNHHPFTFDEAKDLAINVNDPAFFMRRDGATTGVRAFYETGSGRVFCASVKPNGEINEIETLYPKDIGRLATMLASLKNSKKALLDLDIDKAVAMLERQYNTAIIPEASERQHNATIIPELRDSLKSAISVLKDVAGVNGENFWNIPTLGKRYRTLRVPRAFLLASEG